MTLTMSATASVGPDVYGGRDPGDLPAYPLWEVAHFLWVPDHKLRRWATGYRMGEKNYPPLIRIADRASRLLSFHNLAELHVLSFLRDHAVPLQRVRGAIGYLRRDLGDDHPHPLLAKELETDGLDLFSDYLVRGQRRTVNLSGHGQIEMRDMIAINLKRIEWDPGTRAIARLFPYVKPFDSPEEASQQPKVVSIDPRVSFGRPTLAGTSVPTDELAARFSAGDDIAEIARDYDLEPADVQDAIRYQLADRRAA